MVQQYIPRLPAGFYKSWRGRKVSVLSANVVFGQPSLACHGNGLCRVDLDTAMAAPSPSPSDGEGLSCQKIPVRFTYNEKQELQLIISKRELSAQVYAKHFSGPYFLMEEGFWLPDDLVSALSLPVSYLPSGLYPIQKTLDYVTVYLSNQIIE
jgi:hypothetical protein